MTAPGEARPDWWAIAEVATRMGFAGFDYPDAASIFREFAAQTGFENDGARLLDISDRAMITSADYDAIAPFQWGGASPFATRGYATADGRARLVPVRHVPRDDGNRAFPLRLNTGRYRDQWHTMTRTGLSPRLSQHRREPLVEVHPDTVRRLGLEDGGLARVETAQGSSIFRVASTADQRRRELFVPIHWTDQTSAGGRAGLLPARDRDPVSGQPGFKNTPVTASAYKPGWSGFLLSRDLPARPDCAYWTRIRTARGWLTELAGDGDIAPLTAIAAQGRAGRDDRHQARGDPIGRDGRRHTSGRPVRLAQRRPAAARLAGRAARPDRCRAVRAACRGARQCRRRIAAGSSASASMSG